MSGFATAIALHPRVAFAIVLVLGLGIASGATWFLPAGPVTKRTFRLTWAGGLVVAVAAVVFWLMAVGLESSAWTVAFDDALATALAQSPASGLASVLSTLTHLGDRATLIGLVVVVAAVLAAVGKQGLAVAWALACSGNGVLNPALKDVFQRARPIHDAAYSTVGQYSFPSGHTSGSVVVYGMLAYVAMRLTTARWRQPIALAAAAIVVTVACSRVYLRVHWASDVVAGLASGAAWLALCVVVLERVRLARSPD